MPHSQVTHTQDTVGRHTSVWPRCLPAARPGRDLYSGPTCETRIREVRGRGHFQRSPSPLHSPDQDPSCEHFISDTTCGSAGLGTGQRNAARPRIRILAGRENGFQTHITTWTALCPGRCQNPTLKAMRGSVLFIGNIQGPRPTDAERSEATGNRWESRRASLVAWGLFQGQ